MLGTLHRWDISPWLGIPLFVLWLLILVPVGLAVGEGHFIEPAVALLLFSVVSLALVVLFRSGVSLRWRAAALLAIMACIPISCRRGEHRCIDCGSAEHALRFGWGIQNDWAVLADLGDVVPSHAYRDLFDHGHEHRWRGHGRVGGAFIFNGLVTQGSIYCGMWLPNAFAHRYEVSSSFRNEVGERIRSGEVTREEVRRLISLGRKPRRSRTLPQGTHALVARASEWLGEPIWPDMDRESRDR